MDNSESPSLSNIPEPGIVTNIVTGEQPQSTPKGVSELQKAKNIRNRIKQRKIRRLMTLEDTFNKREKFVRYFVMTFPGTLIDNELNVIAVDKELKESMGKARKISKLSKNSILIEVCNAAQGATLAEIKAIAGHPVVVEAHKTMNITKGTVYSEAMAQSSEEEIMEQLKDQGVIQVERMKKKVNGTLTNTNRYILIFDDVFLPPMIKLADWHRELVELYIPPPMRCVVCQKLGHVKKWCRQKEESCGNCCKVGHKMKECINESYCINCRGNHKPNDKKCEAYNKKAEILATQVRERVTYYEASERVRERYVQEGKSYSEAVRHQSQGNAPRQPEITQLATVTSSRVLRLSQSTAERYANAIQEVRDSTNNVKQPSQSSAEKHAGVGLWTIDISSRGEEKKEERQDNEDIREHETAKECK